MRKGWSTCRNILSIFLGAILLLIVSIILFRNAIFTSLIPSITSEHSNGKVSLTLDHVYVGLGGEAYLVNPLLLFDSTYLDKSMSLELKKLSFDTIQLHGASLKAFMSQGLISADSMRVSKPLVWIKEQEGEETSGNLNPEQLLALIQSQAVPGSELKVKVGKIEVDYGKLSLEAMSSNKDSTRVFDFNIYIDNFSSLPEDNTSSDRIFYADDIVIEVSNIDKIFVSGYDLDMGSLWFSIKKNRLLITDIDLFPHILSDSIDQVALSAERIDFNGLSINEISGKEEIELNSARISGGYFTTNTHRVKKTGLEAHNSFFSRFTGILRQFRLDTLGIHEFNIEFMEYLSDSLIWVANLDLELYGVKIDSSMMDDIYRELVYEDFVLTAGPLGYNQADLGLTILADSFYHNSSKHEKTALYNLHMLSENLSSGDEDINVTAGEISIYGISEEPIPYPAKMPLSIFVKDISGTFNHIRNNRPQHKNDFRSIDIFEYIILDTLEIENTMLNIMGNKISAASIGLINGRLNLQDIQFIASGKMGNNRTSFKNLSVGDLDLEQIINENKLVISEVHLNGLQSKGDFITPGIKKPDGSKMQLPFDLVQLGSIHISKCSLDAGIKGTNIEARIKTDLDVDVGAFSLNGPYLSTDELAGIHAKASLRSTRVEILNHIIQIDEVLLNMISGSVFLSGLNIQHNLLDANPGFIIHNLRLPTLEISGLNSSKLIQECKFDPMMIEYRSIFCHDISAIIEFDPDSSRKTLEINNLSVDHNSSVRNDKNIMDDISFSFGMVSFEEAVSNTIFSIGQGNFKNSRNELVLNNISGGNLGDMLNGEMHKKGWNYSSEELLIHGLRIPNGLPIKLSIDKLTLSDANIVVSSDLDAKKSTEMEFEIESFRRFGKLMTHLTVDTTIFREVRVQYKTFSDTSSHTFLADSIGLTIHDIDIDTNVFENAENDIIRKMSINLKGRTRISKDSLYEIRSGLISYDFSKDIISVDSFRVIPRYEDNEFFQKAVFQTDRMKLFGNRIEVHDFRLEELLEDKRIHFGRVDIDSIYLDMLRDKTFARKENDVKMMPQEMLKTMGQKFIIDSVRVFNSYLSYGEIVKKSTLPGIVYFDRFNLNMYNLSSDFPYSDPASALKVNLNAHVMGQTRFDVSLVFPYLGDDNNFWMKAHSEELDLTVLNPFTEQILGLSIKEGHGYIDSTFITGNSIHSKGMMIFRYKKLKLNLYNRKKAEQNKGLFAGITRFLINDIIIHKNNPKFARDPRIGQVYFERDPEKAIVNYSWKSLLSGMLSSIGINKKEQRQEKRETKGK